MGGGPHPLFCPPGYAQTGEGHATERGSRERGRAGTGSPPLCPSFPLLHTTATREDHTQSQKQRSGPPSSPSLHAGATRKRAAAWEWEPACPWLHARGPCKLGATCKPTPPCLGFCAEAACEQGACGRGAGPSPFVRQADKRGANPEAAPPSLRFARRATCNRGRA